MGYYVQFIKFRIFNFYLNNSISQSSQRIVSKSASALYFCQQLAPVLLKTLQNHNYYFSPARTFWRQQNWSFFVRRNFNDGASVIGFGQSLGYFSKSVAHFGYFLNICFKRKIRTCITGKRRELHNPVSYFPESSIFSKEALSLTQATDSTVDCVRPLHFCLHS